MGVGDRRAGIQWEWEKGGQVFNGSGRQEGRYLMGVGDRTGISWEWETGGQVFHESGRQEDRYFMGVGDKENDIQWEWETKKLVLNGSGDTERLAPQETGIQWDFSMGPEHRDWYSK